MQEIRNKKELREFYKRKRKELLPGKKQSLDKEVIENFLNLDEYKSSETVLVYVSKQDEISTIAIIEMAFLDKKKVAAPRCINEHGDIVFYYLTSVKDLEKGYFGILEPIVKKCVKVSNFNSCVCVVPGFCFDKNGYRLGYGKGFYDRFLKGFRGVSVGLCYEENLEEFLPIGEFDEKVDIIVTNKSARFVT